MLVVQSEAEPARIRNALADLISLGVVRVEVASAYVTLEGSSILLRQIEDRVGTADFQAMPKVLVSSFDFGLTEPQALQRWMQLPNGTVRISGGEAALGANLLPRRAFHPKLYAFAQDATNSNVLVGSANLTVRGLSVNTEAAWSHQGLPIAAANEAYQKLTSDSEVLTEELLARYTLLRAQRPPPPSVTREIQPVDAPPPVDATTLQTFRHAVESGALDLDKFEAMWIQCDGLQGGSGNQLELPRGAHRFFHLAFDEYDFPDKKTIGQLMLRYGPNTRNDRLLTWHGNNKMERLNLPTHAQGGFDYNNCAIMFRRLRDGSYEINAVPWESDLAKSWRYGSAKNRRLYRLGDRTHRQVGVL